MYYITYQYVTLDTNNKFASTGDRNPGRLRHRWALYLKSYLDSLYCQ